MKIAKMFKCKKCEVEFRDGVQCSVCLNCFDFPCAGITEAGFRKLGERKATWRCSYCKNLGSTPGKSSEMEGILSELKHLSVQMAILPTLVDNVKKIQEEIVDLKAIKTEFVDLKTSLEFVHQSVSSLTDKVSTIDHEVQSLQSIKEHLSVTHQRLEKLEMRVDDGDQRARLNNIEIKGVPYTSSENLYSIISKIGDIINYKVSKELINYIARVPTRGDNNIKNIIVSLNNRYVKDDFISAARKNKVLTAASLGLAGEKRIFINDHLTLRNKSLLNKTKSVAKELNFTYTWVKNCKIFIRKNSTSPVFTINSELDLVKLSRK